MVRPALSLSAAVHRDIDERLRGADEHLRHSYPGAEVSRQPVHTVYVPGHRYRIGLAGRWGEQARRAITAAGGTAALLRAAAIPDQLAEAVAEQVRSKLATEPIEDLRIDFEDGYGDHPRSEDDDVTAAAQALRTELDTGRAPPFVGIRFKSLEASTRSRGLRTLDLFLTTLAAGELPAHLNLTLPKVSAPAQVEAMVTVCEELESALGLPAGYLRFEVQVETPQAVLTASGSAGVAAIVHAGGGRVSALHYGTYDYSAALGIAPAYQSMDHPAADHAKAVMQLAAAGTGVRLSDGSTNIVPVGETAQVHAAWSLHARLVRRSLAHGYYQGWDLHPAQLPSRFAATYAFYREGLNEAAHRLAAYLGRREHSVLDEPATAAALAGFLRRGLDCGAITPAELSERGGLDAPDLDALARPRHQGQAR